MFARATMLLIPLLGVVGLPAAAQVRELDQAEIRRNVELGNSLPLSRLLSIVDASVAGEIMDVRVFESDGILYRVLIKEHTGRLVAVLVDAGTGRFLSGSSTTARQVMAAAKDAKSHDSEEGWDNGKSGNRGNSRGRDESSDRGDPGDRGNSAGRGNSGNRGNSGDRGNSADRGNSGGKGKGRN